MKTLFPSEEGDGFPFDNFFRGSDIELLESRMGVFSPKVDVTENDKEIKISAELPGLDEKTLMYRSRMTCSR